MIKQSFDDWANIGVKLFGKDKKSWKFVCPRCKTTQSFYDFEKYTNLNYEQIHTQIAFSCIGRNTKEKGCDWTLGGLFKIHEKEVINDNNEVRPMFLFYGEKNGITNV